MEADAPPAGPADRHLPHGGGRPGPRGRGRALGTMNSGGISRDLAARRHAGSGGRRHGVAAMLGVTEREAAGTVTASPPLGPAPARVSGAVKRAAAAFLPPASVPPSLRSAVTRYASREPRVPISSRREGLGTEPPRGAPGTRRLAAGTALAPVPGKLVIQFICAGGRWQAEGKQRLSASMSGPRMRCWFARMRPVGRPAASLRKPALPAEFRGRCRRSPGTWMAGCGRLGRSGERGCYAGCGAVRAGAGSRCMAVRRRTRPGRVCSGRCRWLGERPEGSGEMAAAGQADPGQLLPPPLWPAAREGRQVSPPHPRYPGLPSGLTMAPGAVLPLRALGPGQPCPDPSLLCCPLGGSVPQPTAGFLQAAPAPSLPGGRRPCSSAGSGLCGSSKRLWFPTDPAGMEPLLGNELQCLSEGVSPESGQRLLQLEGSCLLGDLG